VNGDAAATAAAGCPARKAASTDSVTTLDLADAQNAEIEHDGIERAWLRRHGATFPAAEHFLVAAPVGPEGKERPGFQAAWQAVIASGGTTSNLPPSFFFRSPGRQQHET
jgi:hypothetical protein